MGGFSYDRPPSGVALRIVKSNVQILTYCHTASRGCMYWSNSYSPTSKGITMIHWNLVIALTMVAVVLTAITELAESLIKGDKE